MHIEIGHDVTLRRNCTSNQNLTCCMHFLKIINTDVLKNKYPEANLSEKLKNDITFLVGRVVLELMGKNYFDQ